MDKKITDYSYQSKFNYSIFFIGYYLNHTLLRKIKYPTDGSFEFITIIAGENGCDNDPKSDTRDGRTDVFNTLYVNIKIDLEYYDKADEQTKCEYFIELYHRGLQKALTFKDLPYKAMIDALEVLRQDGFRYRWALRSMLVKDSNLRVKFECELNTNEFTMTMEAYRTKPKSTEPVCSGTIIKTMPDEVHFDHVISKKNTIQRDHDLIYICTYWGCRFFYLKISDITNGIFNIYLCPSEYPENKIDVETHLRLQNALLPDNFGKDIYN